MSIHADQLFIQAEIDRRHELFGGHGHGRALAPASRTRGRLARALDRARTALHPGGPVPTAGRPRHP